MDSVVNYSVGYVILFTPFKGQDYPTIKQLDNFLKPESSGVAARWYDLGIQLLDDKDGPGMLDTMKADDVNDCCNKMLAKWLQMKPDATWNQLVTALKNIGMKSVAEDLDKQLSRGILHTNDFILYVVCK